MRVTITGINFNYNGRFDQPYTDVTLRFVTSGFKFNPTESITITHQQYEDNKDNQDGLRTIIVDKILDDVNGYVVDLNDYRDSLQAD